MVFSEYLDRLVNKQNGFVGQHSGWNTEGALYLSSLESRPEEVGVRDDLSELDESQGGEDDEEEQSPRTRGRSKALKKANEQFADPKGKGRANETFADPKGKGRASEQFADLKGKGKANQREQADPSNPSKSQGGEDDHSDKSPPRPAIGTRLTSTALKVKEKFADSKGKSTPRRDSRANTPIRTSRMSLEISSESPSSSSAREVDEKDTESEPEGDDGDTQSGQSSGEGGKAIDEEHTNDEETGGNVPSTTKYWKLFRKVIEDKEETEYGSIDDWVTDALDLIERQKEKLHSMSKD